MTDATTARRWTVALTGGIASGKSAAADNFARRGIDIIDTDLGARAVVTPGSPGLAAVRDAFGEHLITTTGELDRRALRQIVFANTAARQRLEAILHPRIRDWAQRQLAATHSAYAVLVVPLLAETWPAYAWVQRVLVVDAPDELRLQRLMQRDGTTLRDARRMLAAQVSREQRLALADDVILNDGSPEQLDQAVATLHRNYLATAIHP
ncbi:MAG TPA: dephospho-CoA kinase [Rhodanobacteraceae bacterium]|nr:dephospho-CoA kinase [Rhodanobacteraceae bacterium]